MATVASQAAIVRARVSSGSSASIEWASERASSAFASACSASTARRTRACSLRTRARSDVGAPTAESASSLRASARSRVSVSPEPVIDSHPSAGKSPMCCATCAAVSRPRYAPAHAYPSSRRRHGRRRPDRLQPPPPHRERSAARTGPAGDPAAARDHARAGRARGRRDGVGRLRLSAARGHRPQRRRRRRLRRCRLRAARRRDAAQAGHGAQRPAVRQRRDLHGAGRGALAQREPRRARARGRQPGQHERADRAQQRPRPRSAADHGDDAARSQPRREPARAARRACRSRACGA